MANNIIRRVWNQNRMVNIEDLCGMAFQAEADAHTFIISGTDDTGAVVPLTGTVAGVFRRADNADIALTGSASDGVVSVTLTDDCYAVPGRFGLTIFVTSGSQTTAVYAAVGTVSVTSGGAVAGETPQNVVDLMNAIAAAVTTIPADYTDLMAAIAPSYSPNALYPVGSYVWYNGLLYQSIVPITTAETWTAVHWKAAVLGEDIGELKSALEFEKEAIYPIDDYHAEDTVSAIMSLLHSGISLESGSTLGGEWGKRSAISGALLIPPEGMRIETKANGESWVFGVWCYKASTISSGNFVYSPTDKQLISIGQSVIVLPKNGAKYARIQFRRLGTDPSQPYGGYSPLVFEGESGVEEGEGDDTTIRSFTKCFTSAITAPIEATRNLISPYISDDAKSLGINADGDVYHCTARELQGAISWRWVYYKQNLPAGSYTLSFEYSTGGMNAGYLVVKFVDISGGDITSIQLSRSQDLRKYSKVVEISQDVFSVRCYVTSAASASSEVTIQKIQLVSGTHVEKYERPITAIDSIARNAADKIQANFTEATGNLFDLQQAYLDSKNITLEDGVLTGTNTAFKTVFLLADASEYIGKQISITFEGHLQLDADGGKQGIIFVDANDTTLERVELAKPPEAGYRNYIISRTVPEGTAKVRFSEFMVASDKIFQIRNIKVHVDGEEKITTTGYYCGNTNMTAVDAFARDNLDKTASIHDGELFRLDTAPDAVTALSYDGLIDLWDAFAAAYPDNVTKETIGESTPPDGDLTEVYPIYRYTITPTAREWYSESGARASLVKGYERTVLLSGGCHGNEVEAYQGLLLLLKTIYTGGYKYPTLRNLRNKVRFVVIPAWNPYGVEHDQRSMANGGSPYSYFNSETKPGETQAMLDTLDLYGNDLSMWMDFHTDPYAGSSNPRPGVGKDAYPLGCYAYAPAGTRLANALFALVCDFQNLYKSEYNFDIHRIFFSSDASGNGHPTYGISRLPTFVAEIATNMAGFPAAQGSGGMMKLATEWYGNCLAEAIRATARYDYEP